MRSGRARVALAIASAVLVVVSAACRAEVRVAIVQDDAGGGSVTVDVHLDAEALEALGGADEVITDDLTGGGWSVDDPLGTDDGGVRFRATRAFVDATELQRLLDQVAGEGVFEVVSAGVDSGYARTEHVLVVEVATTGDPAQFSDGELTELLGGLPLGYTPDELAAAAVTEAGAATMTVGVQVPGGVRDEAVFDLTGGEPRTATVSSEGTQYETAVIITASAGIASFLAAVVLAVLVLVRTRRGRRAG